jgi:hypothetical protein
MIGEIEGKTTEEDEEDRNHAEAYSNFKEALVVVKQTGKHIS